MVTNTITSSFSPVISNNSKLLTLETSLQQSLLDFKELLIDLEQLHIDCNNYKTQFMKQKEKCDSKICNGANALKEVIEAKDTIIQLVASTLTRLSETKNWTILDEVFKIIFGETTSPSLPTCTNDKENKKMTVATSTKNNVDHKTTVKKEKLISPKKELHSSNEELSFADESMSEIEGTPTGRTSPIIQTKKLKTSMVSLSDRDKKKCPDTWPTPESKSIKLTFTTPIRSKQNSRLRQARLNVIKVKTSNVIDITCSPEFGGGSRGSKGDTECNVQTIKKESMENEDTILPSPTSGPTNFTLFKSPVKFKKPPLRLKSRNEKSSNTSKAPQQDAENRNIKIEKNTDVEDTKKYIDIKANDSVTYTQEDSINILHPNRLPTNFIKSSPVKQAPDDTTFFDTQASVSLLQHVNKLDDIHKENIQLSPNKSPLAENINITNMPDDDELQASMSLLQRDTKFNRPAVDTVKRKIVEPVEDPNEERTPRTRAEKRLLPGWACAQCVDFFSELHKDDPEMMRKKINECSHHRGWKNPERPKTPPGYWNPRWNVPEDTEEFNRKNNV